MTQLVGLANNTKWRELQAFMSEQGNRAPYWRTKSTNGFTYPPVGWDGDWTYHFRTGDYKLIEWCEITPRNTNGALEIADLQAICKRIGFEHEATDSSIRIIGYRHV